MARRQEELTGKIDWITVLLYSALVLFGWMMIYSAVYADDGKRIFDSSINSGKQFQWIIASAIMATLILIIDSRFYVTFSYPIYGMLIALVVYLLAWW